MLLMKLGLLVTALSITIFCIIASSFRKIVRPEHFKIYWAMCLAVLISCVLAIVHQLTQSAPAVTLLMNTIFLFFHSTISVFLFIYVLSYFRPTIVGKKRLLFNISIPLLVLYVFLAANLKTGTVFYMDGDEIARGDLWFVPALMKFLYLASGILYIIAHSNALPTSMTSYLLIGDAVFSLGIILQEVIGRDGAQVELFAEAAVILLLLLNLENDARMTVHNISVYNRAMLTNDIWRMTAMREKFTALDVRITSEEGNIYFLNDRQREILDKLSADVLGRMVDRRYVYMYSSYHFVCLFNENKEEGVEQAAEEIRRNFHDSWQLSDIMVRTRAVVTPIRFPEDVTDADTLNSYLAVDTSYLQDPANIGHPERNIEKMRRITLVERAIDSALQHHSFTVVLQPIYETGTHRAVKMEAFVRLHDPVIGDIPPDELVPVAESSGNIDQIGTAVLNECCRLMTTYHLRERGVRQIHINLSNYQLLDDDLDEEYERIVRKWKLEPSCIAFEVFEDELLKQNSSSKLMLLKLKSRGFLIIYDQFGRSSTNVVRIIKKNVNGVKIDGRVLWGGISSPERQMFLRTIISSIRENGKQVYQTGVETEEQEKFILSTGCSYLQGYRFHRPMREDELNGRLDRELRGEAGEN